MSLRARDAMIAAGESCPMDVSKFKAWAEANPDIRCSRCSFIKHEWHPQPGVNWNRCSAMKGEDGGFVSCSRNRNRDCKEFRRAIVFIPKINHWWEPEL